MAFHKQKLGDLIDIHGLDYHPDGDLFPDIAPVEPGPMLSFFLGDPARRALAQPSEKIRAEVIISPFLHEMVYRVSVPVVVFSGMPLYASDELSGRADFILSRGKNSTFVEEPIFLLIEAKEDGILDGLGQCAAEMVAARDFNIKRKGSTGPIFGCVSSGADWIFLKLDDKQLTKNKDIMYLNEPSRILGVLMAIASGTA